MSDAPAARPTSGTVLVAGAAGGIGRRVAERLSADGWAVVVTDREVDALADVDDSIRGRGGIAHAFGADITDRGQVERYDATELEAKLQRYPSTRLGDASDVAAAVSYLMSDGAAFVNGQVFAVDGGVAGQLTL